ncbi:hypothetical protein MCOR02_002051 [Pyricularia oryzae]|nr:hypothetical protein MCOR02_002051 [Pyricularia oryzae]KAI6313397.1 hypothetical protein MCOR34_005261 [Pyricularia oryzae]KAI6455854.1 hypothetical protein MCOR17_008512 [Pyricularia oryzae]KAI6500436.1 hypothetical protein MCOR13_005964 [Pyricularia oryzae]KAI6574776.1 hypothetical protein MCOR04_007108 [Pyricularia oryzae]
MTSRLGAVAGASSSSSSTAPSPSSASQRQGQTLPNLLTINQQDSLSSNTSSAIATPSRSSSTPSPANTTSFAAPSGSDRVLRIEEFEMDSMAAPQGHRRRRSTHTSPATRSRGPEDRKPHGTADDRDNEVQGGRRLETDDDDSGLSDEDLHDDEEAGLTRKHRDRKRDKRRRNTQFDQRIVRGGTISEEEKREADKNVMRNLVINGVLIGLWYLFSLGISIYNKWMFDSKELDFRFPMFTTSIHMVIQFALSSLVLYFFPSLRPRNGYKSDMGQSRHESEPERPIMTKWFYLTRIGPCGAATGLDIGLGNTSLRFITLTFYTMCKSSSLAFVLMFAFLFRLEAPTWRLVAIIATMTAGVVMMVAGEVEFKLGGFFLVISAAFFSGFRWALTQILLLRNPATSNPFSSIFFLAPIMFLTLFTIAVFVEGLGELVEGFKALAAAKGALAAPAIVIFPGAIAFAMTVSEFALLQRTSVVTLSIAGIFKEVVTISAASIVFGDTLTIINISGLVVTIGAIGAYNYIKITRMREDARATVHGDHRAGGEGAGVNSTSASEDEDEDATLLMPGRSEDGKGGRTLFDAEQETKTNFALGSGGVGRSAEH